MGTIFLVVYILCVCVCVCVCVCACVPACLSMWYVILEHDDKGRANMENSDSNNEDVHSY